MNLRLVNTWYRIRFRHSTDLFDIAVLPRSDPEDLDVYFLALVVVWGTLLAALGLICVGDGWLLHKSDGNQAAAIATVALAFVAGFCLTGAFDAMWRHQLVNAVCRRSRRLGSVDERAHRLLRLARINDSILILQFGLGVVAAVVVVHV